MVATITVLLFPPRLSFSSHVRVESLYGTNPESFDFPELASWLIATMK